MKLLFSFISHINNQKFLFHLHNCQDYTIITHRSSRKFRKITWMRADAVTGEPQKKAVTTLSKNSTLTIFI